MYSAICLLLLSSAALNNALSFDDCGSNLGQFTKVTVSNCDVSSPACVLRKRTNATIEIEFTVKEDVPNVKTVVHGVIAGIHVPFPVPNADACRYSESDISCPLSKDKTYNYKATLPVRGNYPSLSLTVDWALQDQNNNNIVCVAIPAKIQ